MEIDQARPFRLGPRLILAARQLMLGHSPIVAQKRIKVKLKHQELSSKVIVASPQGDLIEVAGVVILLIENFLAFPLFQFRKRPTCSTNCTTVRPRP